MEPLRDRSDEGGHAFKWDSPMDHSYYYAFVD